MVAEIKNYYAVDVPKIARLRPSENYAAFKSRSRFLLCQELVGGRIEVTTRSPRDQRLAVWHIKNNLIKECPWVYPEYSHRGQFVEENCRSFLWFDSAGPGRMACVGAACFFYKAFENDISIFPTLHWVWLHPFCRKRGLFTALWRDMEAELPRVSAPMTEAMIGFLANKGYATNPRWAQGHGAVVLAKRAD